MDMNFWRRWGSPYKPHHHKINVKGPTNIPIQIGMYLVLQEKKAPDWIWTLSCVECPQGEYNRRNYNFRLFSSSQASLAGVQVTNYFSLDDHPELILYFGWYERNGSGIGIEEGPSGLAA
jgi:hypothetical protein